MVDLATLRAADAHCRGFEKTTKMAAQGGGTEIVDEDAAVLQFPKGVYAIVNSCLVLDLFRRHGAHFVQPFPPCELLPIDRNSGGGLSVCCSSLGDEG